MKIYACCGNTYVYGNRMTNKHTLILGVILLSSSATVTAGSLNCRIEPHTVVNVSSPIEGLVGEVFIEKNQEVIKGQELAKLESSVEAATVDLRRAQAEMNSDIDARKLTLEFSKRNLKRIEDLYKSKATSFSQLDEARTEHALAAQQLQQAKDRKTQAELEFARASRLLERRTIKSPINGLVVERYKEPGEHIDNEPMMQLAQLDPLKVEVFAPSGLFGKVQVGMTARVLPQTNSRKRSYLAEVVMVDRVIDAPSNTFGIRLSFPNPDYQLPSGLKCTVEFAEDILPSPKPPNFERN